MNSETPNPMPLHPVRIVVQRTGLTPDLLRAWEKRYGVVTPTRSAGGQRLYSDADLERLALLKRAVNGGRNIGQVAKFSVPELKAVVLTDADAPRATPAQAVAFPTESAEAVLAAALLAVERFDAAALESTLRAAVLCLGVDQLLDEVLGPLLFTIGSRWKAGLMRPAHEHLATAVIRRTLSWLIECGRSSDAAPTVVVTTLAGQTHEFGALLAAATAVSHGWGVVYLGTSLQTRATAVALSLVYPTDDPAIPNELRELRAALPPGTGILAGGGASPDYMAALEAVGAYRFATIREFRLWLRDAASTR
jgi:MerR family transcriptional regulator, light-induced transcriptional regulator